MKYINCNSSVVGDGNWYTDEAANYIRYRTVWIIYSGGNFIYALYSNLN